jgi:hypothetical protein
MERWREPDAPQMHPAALRVVAPVLVLDDRKPMALQGLSESGASRTRTDDLLGAIQALSQLSYSPERRHIAARMGTV